MTRPIAASLDWFCSHEDPISAAAARRREDFFALFSLPTIEIEGRRPADFPTTFRNQGGRRLDPDFYRNASYCTTHPAYGLSAQPRGVCKVLEAPPLPEV